MKKSLFNNILDNGVKSKRKAVVTGYGCVDDYIGNIKHDGLYIVAGGIGSGVTSLMLNMARNIASQGKKVCFFSISSNAEEIVRRLIVQKTGTMGGNLLAGNEIGDSGMKLIEEEIRKLRRLPINIDDMLCPDVVSVMDSILINKEYLKTDVIMIDGLDMLTSYKSYVNLKDECADILREIRKSQYILDVPVIASVNITMEKRDSHGPIGIEDLESRMNSCMIAEAVMILNRENDAFLCGNCDEEETVRLDIYSRYSEKPRQAELSFDREHLSFTEDVNQ